MVAKEEHVATVTKVAEGVWRAGTRWVNWYMIDAGRDGVALVDAGLPAYHRQLDNALGQIGRQPTDVRALVMTHGHIDHIGMASVLAGRGAAIYLHPGDAKLASDPRSNKTERPLLPYLRYPATLAFVAHCVAKGAVRPAPMPAAVPLTEGELVAVPGRPVVTHTPGHTDGSCVLEFKEHGVVFAGDLLCTASPVTGRRTDPQIQTRGSNRSSDQAMASLERLQGVQARLVLPGHGVPWRHGVEAAVDSARRFGCR
ncbi:MAG: MBL fold metallo-hydrolase [Actinomycetota bacterium]|nr:MBL fold metallo-hydrolase [Actinomycetota bacterium]